MTIILNNCAVFDGVGDTLLPGRSLVIRAGRIAEIHERTQASDSARVIDVGGRGLGLSAMLGILRGHRGSIDLTTTMGKGTRFRVLLPTSPAPDHAPQPAPASQAKLSGRVLLADDEPSVLAVSRGLLETLGFEVISASNGLEALRTAERLHHEFRVAVLDLSMPGMGGREVAQRLRQQRADLPIVLMSGYAGEDAASCLLDERMHFLGKPFRYPDLKRMLERALEPTDVAQR